MVGDYVYVHRCNIEFYTIPSFIACKLYLDNNGHRFKNVPKSYNFVIKI